MRWRSLDAISNIFILCCNKDLASFFSKLQGFQQIFPVIFIPNIIQDK
uniref:Putative disease resistance RPP13-like protein 1 n=1 Tax=Rhizophora mucronata TaxID=61149 RepID=A0A2P2MWH4_RHIMU